MDADETTTVNLTNKYELGSLEITKTITDFPGEGVPTVSFTVSDERGFSETFTLADDFELQSGKYVMTTEAKAKLTDIAVGDYTVTETVTDEKNYSYTATYIIGTDESADYPTDGIPATVDADETTTVNLTNKYELGNLEITKTIAEYNGKTKPIVSFTVSDERGFSETFTLADDFEMQSGKYVMTTEAKAKLIDIPVGDYTVTETVTDIEGYRYTATYSIGTNGSVDYPTDGITATVDTDETTIVNLINTYERILADVQVTKAFSGIDNLPTGFMIKATYTMEGEEDPTNVFFTVGSDGMTGTGTSSDPYTWTIKDLPTGTEVTFVESGIELNGHKLEVSGTATASDDGKTATATAISTEDEVDTAKFVNTYTPILIPVAIRKVWDDDDDRDGMRPLKLTVYLKANGKTIATRELNVDNDWTRVEESLRKCDQSGNEIEYKWEEGEEAAQKGYSLTNTKTTGLLTTLTNARPPEKTSISVKKIWKDSGNAVKTHPDITVQLFANGKAEGDPVTLNEKNGWKWTWTDLCKNAKVGNVSKPIDYTVEELEIPAGYKVKISGDSTKGFVITNTADTGKLEIQKIFDIKPDEPGPEPEPSFIDIPVVKIWNDNDNKDGNRPASITVHLLSGGTEINRTTLTEDNGWTYTFEHLPKYKDGMTIRYSIEEDPVDQYVTQIDGYTITNKYMPTLTSVSVRKVWDDNNNEMKMRPTSIKMYLSNGMSVILSDENGWSATISGLPTIVNGNPAVYTWKEAEIPGYRLESCTEAGSVTVFTNRILGFPKIPDGEKKPKLPGGHWGIFEEYDTALGGQLLINHVGDCFD